MSIGIPANLRREVRYRANNRCEYCGLSSVAQEATFHIDHVVPLIAGGLTEMHNLALACVSCSLRKGARLEGRDPHTGATVALFHPRLDLWSLHFSWDNERLTGLTPEGRATVLALSMNRSLILAIRREEIIHGRHPPPG